MKKYIKAICTVIYRGLVGMSPSKQFGLVSIAGALVGIYMMVTIPEFGEGMGTIAVLMLAVVGIICLEFGDVILPPPPADDHKKVTEPPKN